MGCYAQYVAYESGQLLRRPLCCSAHWPARQSANEESCQALCEDWASQGGKMRTWQKKKGREVAGIMEEKGSVLELGGGGCRYCLSGEAQVLNLFVPN